jgi:spore germination protein KB
VKKVKNVRISAYQLFILMLGFILGDAVIIYPGREVYQDAWLAVIIGWMGSYLLIGVYIYISLLHPGKTLIEILRDTFGRLVGNFLAVLYIWYFIHISSLVFRSFGEYMVVVNYPESPRIFISIVLGLFIAYGLKQGLEVLARAGELGFPLIPFNIMLLSVVLIQFVEIGHLFPFLERGFAPVLKAGYGVLTFPFGETVVFLMIFPFINTQKNLLKSSFAATTLGGLLLLIISVRNILVLGPDMVLRTTFPGHTISALVHGAVLDPFLSVTFLILGAFQSGICAYAAVLGITQLAHLDDHKPLVLPVMIIILALSNWIYDNLPDMFRVAAEIYPFYAIPFQIMIPLVVLVISLIKQKKVKLEF